jgi:hypothetical protein
MNDQKYNGWTNYQTWRIALEWFDDDMSDLFDLEQDPDELAMALREFVEIHIEDSIKDTYLVGYVYHFLQAVDWQEIAEHLIENNEE